MNYSLRRASVCAGQKQLLLALGNECKVIVKIMHSRHHPELQTHHELKNTFNEANNSFSADTPYYDLRV